MASINKMKDNGKTENKRKRHCELPEQLPPINSLKDLISLGGRKHRHQNINMDSLWEIMPHLQELDNMIGMETVKTSVFKQVIYYLQELHHKDIDGEYLHATRVFTLSQASKFILTEEDINEGLKMVKANSHEVILNDTFLTMFS